MQTDRFIRRAVIVTSLTLFPWLPMLLTHAADQPPGVGIPSQEIPKAITDAQPSIPRTVPVVGGAPAQAVWVDDIMNALRMYFTTNYPTCDFAPYLKQLTLVQDAVDRGDRGTVTVEMGMFFTMLANRADGMSEVAADELANFARVVMQEYGIFLSRSGLESRGSMAVWLRAT
jgi:hypothetical protein